MFCWKKTSAKESFGHVERSFLNLTQILTKDRQSLVQCPQPLKKLNHFKEKSSLKRSCGHVKGSFDNRAELFRQKAQKYSVNVKWRNGNFFSIKKTPLQNDPMDR